MSSFHFDVNRPIHMARRDVFYEKSVQLLYTPTQSLDTLLRIDHIEHVLTLLKTAETHAFLALRANSSDAQESNFLQFLRLITGNVQSVHAMLRHQLQLESGEGFLSEFLGAQDDEALLPAFHYQRRAKDILQGLWHVLRLAEEPYKALQAANCQAFSADQRARYDKAVKSFQEEVTGGYKVPPPENDDPPTTCDSEYAS